MDLLGILFIVVALILIDLAALRWGVDSRDGFNALEWRRRQDWTGFH